mmetsp:Transcript_12762/g.30543  ORF Transcript_12762/g.30543 Transcript_12762/m.30543 type:complete len:320 (+) Transcript_12762:52-1011(+)
MTEECRLLGGWFAKGVQLALFISTMSVLVAKYCKTKDTGRSFFVFCVDSSKQYAGAGFIHIMNLLLAEKLNGMFPGGDPCDWYWVNLVVDCTLGVFVAWFFLQSFLKVLVPAFCANTSGLEPGNYGDGEFKLAVYVKQMVFWLTVVFFMKLTMLCLMAGLGEFWLWLSSSILDGLDATPRVKLVVVMCITPAFFNGLQFWLQDNFLRHKKRGEPLLDHQASVEVGTPRKLTARARTASVLDVFIPAQFTSVLFGEGDDLSALNGYHNQNVTLKSEDGNEKIGRISIQILVDGENTPRVPPDWQPAPVSVIQSPVQNGQA